MLGIFSQARVKFSSSISQISFNTCTARTFNSFLKRRNSPLDTNISKSQEHSSLNLQQKFRFQHRNYFTKKNELTNPLFSSLFKTKTSGKFRISGFTLVRNYTTNWTPNSVLSKLDGIDPNKLSKSLILINVVFFALIQIAFLEKNPAKKAQLKAWINKNMTFSGINFKQGRFWTIFTSSFTHFEFWHLITNLLSLFFFAPPVRVFKVAASLGSRRFLQLYVASCLTSHLTFFSYNQLNKSRPVGNSGFVEGDLVGSIGASGSTMAILAYFGCKFPFETIYLYFFPVPAFIAVAGLFVYDYIRCRRPARSNSTEINHVAHLGGAVSGLIFFLLTRRPPPSIRPNAFGRFR